MDRDGVMVRMVGEEWVSGWDGFVGGLDVWTQMKMENI